MLSLSVARCRNRLRFRLRLRGRISTLTSDREGDRRLIAGITTLKGNMSELNKLLRNNTVN
jgi:hypothetical protein